VQERKDPDPKNESCYSSQIRHHSYPIASHLLCCGTPFM
jgi:hypothetical protein